MSESIGQTLSGELPPDPLTDLNARLEWVMRDGWILEHWLWYGEYGGACWGVRFYRWNDDDENAADEYERVEVEGTGATPLAALLDALAKAEASK